MAVLLHPDRFSTSGVSIRKRGVCVHTNEGPDGSGASLLRYLQRPGDRPLGNGRMYGSGYHAIAEPDGWTDIADAACGPYHAPPVNKTWWSICIPGYAAQTRDQWLDPQSRGFIRGVARYIVDRSGGDGFPLRRPSLTELRDGAGGYCSHVDVARAWGQTDHTDPGPNFPWDVLAADIAELTAPTPPIPLPQPVSTEDVMLAIYRPTFAAPPNYDPAWFVVFASGAVRRATNPDVTLAGQLQVPTITLDSPEQYGELLRASGSQYPPLP